MNEFFSLAAAVLAGLLLGVLFFAGLWWTIQKSFAAERPELWILGSLLLRMGVASAGFYFVGREHWQQLVACLLGFVMARCSATWLSRTHLAHLKSGARQTQHAP